LLLALLLSACQPIQRLPETKAAVAASAQTPLEQANQAVVQRFYDEVVNNKNFDAFAEVFDPNMVEHSLGIGVILTDTEILTAFPDLHLTVDLLVVEGDLVTAVVTTKGTHQAEFMGVAPTGNPISWSSIDIWRVKDGKITDVWHDFPNEDILQQVGYTLVPPTK